MRSVATLAVGLLLLLLQSTVMEVSSVHVVTPTLGLLTVLYVGFSPLKWGPGSAALVGLALGYLFDLVAAAPRGVHAFVFLVMALFAAFVASLLCACLIVVVRAQVSPESGYGGLRQAPLEALLTGAFAPPVLWLLGRLDGRLDPALLRVGLSRRRARALGPGLPPR
jgi:hypothetical protein